MFSRVLGGRLKTLCGSGIIFTLRPKRGPAPGHLEDISRSLQLSPRKEEHRSATSHRREAAENCFRLNCELARPQETIAGGELIAGEAIPLSSATHSGLPSH